MSVAPNDGKRAEPVAIIVPCYNAEASVAETLETAVGQPCREIIAIDDGSADSTWTLVRQFEPDVRVVAGPNRGVSTARNRGIAETTAEWLLFLDADDLLTPGTIAARLQVARDSGADVIITDWEELIDNGDGTTRPGRQRSVDWDALAEDAELATATHVWAPPAAILYRRSLVERIGGFRLDLPVIQDARFLFDAAFHGARFAHSPHVGAKYRIAPGSLSRRDPGRFWEDVLRNGKQIEALWRARGTFSAARRRAVCDIYGGAVQGLFAAAHPSYFAAVEAQRRLGLPTPWRTRIAAPLAHILGLSSARSVLGLARAVSRSTGRSLRHG